MYLLKPTLGMHALACLAMWPSAAARPREFVYRFSAPHIAIIAPVQRERGLPASSEWRTPKRQQCRIVTQARTAEKARLSWIAYSAL